MRRFVLIGIVVTVGCANAQDRQQGEIPGAVGPAAYTVYIVDDEWERIEYGYVKVREIAMPPANLEACAGSEAEDPLRQVEAEAAAELARLNELDWHRDGWREREYVVVDRRCYHAADAHIVLVQLRTAEREYGSAAVGLLRAGQELLLFAEAEPYLQEMTLQAFEVADGVPVVYGHRRGSPAQPYGGDFALSLEGNKRTIRYSYFEETQ